MSNFSDLINKNKEKEVVPTAEPATATASLAEALNKNKNTIPNNKIHDPVTNSVMEIPPQKSGGFKFKGLKKKGELSEKQTPAISNSCDTQVASNPESETREETSPTLDASPPVSSSTPEFVHPEQSDKYTPEQAQVIYDNMSVLRDNITDKEIVAQVMRQILNGIRENENLKTLMKPEDCGLMVRHLRMEYGTEIKKRSVKVTKKQETAKEVDEIADMLGDFG